MIGGPTSGGGPGGGPGGPAKSGLGICGRATPGGSGGGGGRGLFGTPATINGGGGGGNCGIPGGTAWTKGGLLEIGGGGGGGSAVLALSLTKAQFGSVSDNVESDWMLVGVGGNPGGGGGGGSIAEPCKRRDPFRTFLYLKDDWV